MASSGRRGLRDPCAHSQVLVVGAGPVGLTAAHLLGSAGVRVLLVERNADVGDDAEAVTPDDEYLRILQRAGVNEAIHLERVLLAALAQLPTVETSFDTRLFSLQQRTDRVRAWLGPTAGGQAAAALDVPYVLGCDGDRSSVRELLGIPMQGRSCPDVWLVVDTLDDPHDQAYGMRHRNPRHPAVVVPGGGGRCRYEFRLRPGECAPGASPPFTLVRELLRPYREISVPQVERVVASTSHALLADRLREGRCFLLGNAAHMMPPFAGQGLSSGLQDAVNLCWKVAEVLTGRAGDPLLDTYDTERRPSLQAVVERSVRLGDVAMTTSTARARLRDLCVRTALRTSWGNRCFGEMRCRPDAPVRIGAVVPSLRGRTDPLVGTALPLPMVLHGTARRITRLDKVLGPGWSLLGAGVSEDDWATVEEAGPPADRRVDLAFDDPAPRDTSGRIGIADADGGAHAAFSRLTERFILVRPDRLVAAVFDAEDAEGVTLHLERFALQPLPNPLDTPATSTAAPVLAAVSSPPSGELS
ncbi:FAD-dependent monooxygenase [Streptomyces pseudovenezuelae]|uniref:FAD-dependent monooxygenase n=1 Tax=Streptomyces pseudovenezuelae TaxID=67350 RepID=UPI0024734178|nr:FAD-dependent monooxygenase [Streptomyces pseudovenezuelae]